MEYFNRRLQWTVGYQFADKTIVLCFWDKDFEWSLASITGLYNFNVNSDLSDQIIDSDIEEITGCEFIHNIIPKGDIKAKVFKVNIRNLVRHILIKQFTITLNYYFFDDPEMKLWSSKFIFDVQLL